MIQDKIKSLSELSEIRYKLQNEKVVFTNGVFDILHRGHVEYLEQARLKGDSLIVGLNSDVSVRKIKGKGRPIVSENDRALVLAALSFVDYVCLFDEDTPEKIISTLIPDVLVKGGDYKLSEIVGREVVEKNGGEVVTIPLTPDRSTTDIIDRIVKLAKEGDLDE